MKKEIYNYLDYRAFLRDSVQELKGARRWNLRRFAKLAGVKAPGYLKMVTDGRRNLTVKTAEKFCRALDLKGREKKYFVTLVCYNQTTNPDRKNEYGNRLHKLRPRTDRYLVGKHQFRYFSRPHYVCIREMVTLKDFREDPKWIARRCFPPISPAEARTAIDVLLDLGFLARDENCRLIQKEDFVHTEDVNTQAFEAYHFHEAMIDLARHALTQLPQEERNYYALTVPMPQTLYKEVIQEFYAFRDRVLEKTAAAGGTGSDEVFQINFQLFPLTRKRKNGAKL